MSIALAVVACGDDERAPAVVAIDSGVACERGTENCACTSSGSCGADLLCVAGRCLSSGGSSEPYDGPPDRPTPAAPNDRPRLDSGSGSDAEAPLPDASDNASADAATDARTAPDNPPAEVADSGAPETAVDGSAVNIGD